MSVSLCWRVITGHQFSSRFTVVRYGITWHKQCCACSHVSSCFTSTIFWWKKEASQGLKPQKPTKKLGPKKTANATLMAIFIYQMLSLCSSKTLPFMKLLSSTRAAFKDVRIWKALCQRLPADVRIKGVIFHIQSCLSCCAQQKRVWPLKKNLAYRCPDILVTTMAKLISSLVESYSYNNHDYLHAAYL